MVFFLSSLLSYPYDVNILYYIVYMYLEWEFYGEHN